MTLTLACAPRARRLWMLLLDQRFPCPGSLPASAASLPFSKVEGFIRSGFSETWSIANEVDRFLDNFTLELRPQPASFHSIIADVDKSDFQTVDHFFVLPPLPAHQARVRLARKDR